MPQLDVAQDEVLVSRQWPMFPPVSSQQSFRPCRAGRRRGSGNDDRAGCAFVALFDTESGQFVDRRRFAGDQRIHD